MQLEWDKKKSLSNLKKHGLDFETAALVFEDPFIFSSIDTRFYYGEERWQGIGIIEESVIYIIYTVRGHSHEEEIIRVISARKAIPSEAKRYYANREST